jgi:hypothetical protein
MPQPAQTKVSVWITLGWQNKCTHFDQGSRGGTSVCEDGISQYTACTSGLG